ncbi:MAG TPA: hypothetical protein VGF53_04220 [Pseudolabrys sp.]|jgi:hypothetical protein
MADTSNPATPPAVPAQAPKTFWQKAQAWAMIALGIIIGLLGLLKLYNAFAPQLPGCAADSTTALIRDIFKEKNAELTVLNNIKTVSETSSLQSCEAHIETAAETATISYNITLQGSNFQVLITKVDAKPR